MTDPRILAILICDLEQTWLGTRSRLGDQVNNRPLLRHILDRVLQIAGIQEIAILAPESQLDKISQLLGPEDRVRVLELQPRPASMSARIRAGRAWNLTSWRGGAGQWTCFDEEFHPAAIAAAAASAFNGTGAEHILHLHSHSLFLDTDLTAALIQHHLHKNHEMRVTYTPAAPGISGMVFRADILKEMGEKNVLPYQLLSYDPKAPAFDTLIRDACMQVDPALSKIPNRFCVDTQRYWDLCQTLAPRTFTSVAELCLAAARTIAPGVTDFSHVTTWPREVEIELARERLTRPPGYLPGVSPGGEGGTPAPDWVSFMPDAQLCDDLLITFGGNGDPLLHPPGIDLFATVARQRGALSICVQTDLAGGDIDGLIDAAASGVVDVVSVTMYGHTRETYAKVAGADLHPTVMKNLERLAAATTARGGMPLVIPRLLKVRDTIPEMEPFFDFWIERTGWAVIDYPTDRAGALPFAGVVDMAPPKRRPCRRLWDRLLIHANGTAVPCDQDMHAKIPLGNIESINLQQMWHALNGPRERHALAQWNELLPCRTCKEWHRA